MDAKVPKVEIGAGVRILTFAGGDGSDIEEAISREMNARGGVGEGHLLLDFTNVAHISSEGLGALVSLHKRVRIAGGRLTLFNLSPQIYEVFEVTHLHALLGICREV
jgi:anti-anti-sigma factor